MRPKDQAGIQQRQKVTTTSLMKKNCIHWQWPDWRLGAGPAIDTGSTPGEGGSKEGGESETMRSKLKQGGGGPLAKSLSPISEPIMDEDDD